MSSSSQTSEPSVPFEAALLEALPVGVYVCAADGRIVQFNRRAVELFGREPRPGEPEARFYGSHGLIRIDGSILPHDETPMAEALQSGEAQHHREVEVERPDGSRIVVLASVELVRDAEGRVVGAINSVLDITKRVRAEIVREQLVAIVESSDDAIVSKDLDGIIESWNRGAERLFGYTAGEICGQSILRLIPEGHEHEEASILDRVRRGIRVEPYDTVRRRKDGELIDVSVTVSPVRDGAGRIVGASKIARDIGERKKAEAQRELLLAELNHRVKNSLATVVSIARQTFSGVGDASDALPAFESRLRSLAQTHTRLAESTWAGSPLDGIFADELAPFAEEHDGRVRIAGPKVTLGPRSAVTLGMAVHELATNAAKHGALSRADGRVEITWWLGEGRRDVRIEWLERGGPPVAAPQRSGFGRLLLERAVPAELDGDVELDFAPGGLRCSIRIPLAEPIAWAG